jgi:hypothetical protein
MNQNAKRNLQRRKRQCAIYIVASVLSGRGERGFRMIPLSNNRECVNDPFLVKFVSR